MLKLFFNFLTGGLLEKGLDAWGIWLNKRNERIRIEREMYGERVRANTTAKILAQGVLIAEQGWWVTRLIRPFFAYPLAIYWSAHIARAIYFHDWIILPLPEFMQEWSGWIIAAYFLMRPVEKIGRNYGSHMRSWVSRTVESLKARQRKK